MSTTMAKSLTAISILILASSSLIATVDAGGAAQETLWYPDYASYASSGYEQGRCTNQPSASLLKLASYASSGYANQTACCQESFPGQQRNSYCSCMGDCSSHADLARDDDRNADDNFNLDVFYEKLLNEAQAFEMYQAEQEDYWSTMASLPSLPSLTGSKTQTKEI
ncbi:hypothetical protein ACHAXM_009620 [Skeletonema potamos]|jgi:hypothetical protein